MQCGARLPIHTLNFWAVQSVVPGSYLRVCLSVTDRAHRRSVAVFCMLFTTRCNPIHTLNDALPGLYVSVRVTRGALVAHRYTYVPPRRRTSQYCMTIVPLSVSL